MKNNSWISVAKKLPENFQQVLVTNGSGMLIAACSKMKQYDTALWITPAGRCFPTHWMLLPEPPQEAT